MPRVAFNKYPTTRLHFMNKAWYFLRYGTLAETHGFSMTLTASRLSQFILTIFVVGLFALTPLALYAANKVPTSRVFVPEEKPAPAKDSLDDIKGASPSEIPLDALPSTKQQSATSPDADSDKNAEDTRKNMPLPEVMRDFSKLPAPVRRMRELILTTAKKGDIEALRSLVGIGETATTLSIGGLEGDPIEYLKGNSGDAKGFEILAILIEVLEAGYIHLDAGKEDELYVWPYFFAWPLEKLPPELRVELFRILTAGDVEDSENSGRYIFYRVGIKPDGQWAFFVAGD